MARLRKDAFYNMSATTRKEYNVYIPSKLDEELRKVADTNMRSLRSEIAVAARNYAESNAQDKPPLYEPGDLNRIYVKIPNHIHNMIEHIAVDRRWSVNRVYMAAINRHVRRELNDNVEVSTT